jgi:hypothetical protein
MWPAAAALVALSLAVPPSERVLVCRPPPGGELARSRADAIAAAARELGEEVLDYGVPCETSAEAARAARRAGLGHAVQVAEEAGAEGSLLVMTVVDVEDRAVAVRRLEVGPGSEAVRAIASSLAGLVAELPRPERLARRRRAALGVAGGGGALLVAGAVLAGLARAQADRANAAATPEDYLEAKASWERRRGWSAAVLGIGGAALAAGLAWRFDLGREE